LKKEIKRNLVEIFRKSVSKLIVTQKILLATLTLLKSQYSKLNPTLSHISHYIHQFNTKSKTIFSNMSQLGFLLKTKAITTISYLVQFKYQIKKRKYKIIMLGVLAFFVFNLFLLNLIGGQLVYRTSLQSHGAIRTIGIAAYKDSSCTTPVSDVNWGTITPGFSSTNTIYVRNEGNSDLMLSLDMTNWNPTNTRDYMTLSWNSMEQTIKPNQVVQLTLTLSVSQNINGIESFNFDIIILGTD